MEQDERRLKVYRDWKSTVETAEFKGHERGLEEGLAKGEEIGLAKGEEIGLAKGEEIGLAKGRIEFARLMKASNEPRETIIQYTHLTEEEINKL